MHIHTNVFLGRKQVSVFFISGKKKVSNLVCKSGTGVDFNLLSGKSLYFYAKLV